LKTEIKKGIIELQGLKDPVEYYESIKEQIAKDKEALDIFKLITKQSKECIWSFTGMTKKAHTQTEIKQD